MMNEEIEQEMLSYYDERAKEHDEVYVGKGPAIQRYSSQYIKDVTEISKMISGSGRGHGIDIACGTGFWAPHYAHNCNQITFLDQSESMLSECKRRMDKLGLASVPHFIRGDFFDVALESSAYDCALVGFLLSHFTSERERVFWGKLGEILRSCAQLMVIDSLWTERRREYCRKEGIEERALNDGRRFRVYKKYFEQWEFEGMFERYRFTIKSLYVGDMFIAAIAERANYR